MFNKIYKFFKYLSFKCDPFLACSKHGRCWTHSNWDDTRDWLYEDEIKRFGNYDA